MKALVFCVISFMFMNTYGFIHGADTTSSPSSATSDQFTGEICCIQIIVYFFHSVKNISVYFRVEKFRTTSWCCVYEYSLMIFFFKIFDLCLNISSYSVEIFKKYVHFFICRKKSTLFAKGECQHSILLWSEYVMKT